MSETIENNNETKRSKGNVLGIVALIVGVIAWLILYKYQWGGISLAVVSVILSIIGLKGRFRNMAIGAVIISGVLLIVVGIMWAAFYYIFQSIQ